MVLVRTFALDVYPVREQSMWPVLAGDREWVLVDKLAPFLGKPGRFDLCVFRHTENGVRQLFVKRLLGLGGEVIDFQGGDLFVGSGDGKPARLARPEALIERQIVPVPPGRQREPRFAAHDFQVEGGRIEAADRALTLVPDPGRTVSGALIGGPGVDPLCIKDDRLGPDGRTVARGRHAVPDVRITVGPVSLGAGTFSIAHEIGRGETRTVSCDGRDLTVVARIHGVDETRARFPGVSCANGIRMETIDGSFRVLLPEAGGWNPLFREGRDTEIFDGDSRVRLEAAGAPVRVAWLEVARDVHYVWGDSPSNQQLIPPGRLFLVGDNPEVSRDSRDGHFGAVPEEDLVGLVRAVVWPSFRLPR